MLVGGRVYFLAFSLAGPDSTPDREVDQRNVWTTICPCHSPTLRPWITVTPIDATTSYVEERWSPALAVTFGNAQA